MEHNEEERYGDFGPLASVRRIANAVLAADASPYDSLDVAHHHSHHPYSHCTGTSGKMSGTGVGQHYLALDAESSRHSYGSSSSCSGNLTDESSGGGGGMENDNPVTAGRGGFTQASPGLHPYHYVRSSGDLAPYGAPVGLSHGHGHHVYAGMTGERNGGALEASSADSLSLRHSAQRRPSRDHFDVSDVLKEAGEVVMGGWMYGKPGHTYHHGGVMESAFDFRNFIHDEEGEEEEDEPMGDGQSHMTLHEVHHHHHQSSHQNPPHGHGPGSTVGLSGHSYHHIHPHHHSGGDGMRHSVIVDANQLLYNHHPAQQQQQQSIMTSGFAH